LRRITQAVESTSDAISIFDLSGKGLYQNQAFINLYGYTIDELNAAGGPGSMFVAPELVNKLLHDSQRSVPGVENSKSRPRAAKSYRFYGE
jgi:PAS domain S-box-containing protein